ncbi:solute carrier family 35 member b1 [Anaeramoeba flamelloides]|uniref:Solute carrier family 35 member b1 n=1 Tax=Anaeramoeba flamelloides TaxID=1746091 RepID=A0AAV7ZG52_9EUKA|nr:solute carrier family 35 member b1 [Anaeramoeba flamelloides]
MTYGVKHEKLLTTKWQGGKFTFTLTFLLSITFSNALFALFAEKITQVSFSKIVFKNQHKNNKLKKKKDKNFDSDLDLDLEQGIGIGVQSQAFQEKTSTQKPKPENFKEKDRKRKRKRKRKQISNKMRMKRKLIYKGVNRKNHPPPIALLVPSLLLLCTMVTGYFAFNYTSYPTQILVKSCKPVSVMLLGMIIFGKRYRYSKIICMIVLVSSISIFCLENLKNKKKLKMAKVQLSTNDSSESSLSDSGPKSGQEAQSGIKNKRNDKEKENAKANESENGTKGKNKSQPKNYKSNKVFGLINKQTFGLILMCIALLFDGVYGPSIDHLNKKFPESGKFYSMFWINFWMGLIILILIVATGEAYHAVTFFLQNKQAIPILIACDICMSTGQLFIFFGIYNFDSFIISIITTARKFFSILFSIIIYHHAITFTQWVSIFLVFFALSYMITNSSKKKKHWEYVPEKYV